MSIGSYGTIESLSDSTIEYNQSPSSFQYRHNKIMKCVSCSEEYTFANSGTCKECYEEATETKQDLKREIQELKLKNQFLKMCCCDDDGEGGGVGFSDVVLIGGGDGGSGEKKVKAHKAVLASRSPVFKAMLENDMEESRSGMIKITDVPYHVLRSFVNYLYTAEVVSMDEQIAYDLLDLAEKYEVKHLKTYCEKFMSSKLTLENSLVNFAFASQHNAEELLKASKSLITDNMHKISKTIEYKELLEKDPLVIVGIYEAYLAKQENTAASNHTVAPKKPASRNCMHDFDDSSDDHIL